MNQESAKASRNSRNRMMNTQRNAELSRFFGRGGYRSSVLHGAAEGGLLGSIGGAEAGAMLGTLGGPVAPLTVPVGATIGALGGGLGGAISGGYLGKMDADENYHGNGDYMRRYDVNRNQIAGGGPVISVNRAPDYSGDIFITQTEFIGNLHATVDASAGTAVESSPFRVESYDINPGMGKLFPFLSQIAQNYELYEWQGLMVKYTPNSGETSLSSNQLGKVILATNYDPTAPAFVNSIQMQNYDYANSSRPSGTIVHGIETERKRGSRNMMYTRTIVPNTKSLMDTDIGKLWVATEGVPIVSRNLEVTSVILGELHVTYKVRLSRAKLFQNILGYGIDADRWSGTGPAGPIADDSQLFPDLGNPLHPFIPWKFNTGSWNISTHLDQCGAIGTGCSSVALTATENLVGGCYRWKMYCDVASGPIDSTIKFSGLTTTDGISIIQQRGFNGNLVDYLYSEDLDDARIRKKIIATGYVSLDNSADQLPWFKMRLHRNINPTCAGSMFTKITIEQVSCHVSDLMNLV